jgi:hypothetical protein
MGKIIQKDLYSPRADGERCCVSQPSVTVKKPKNKKQKKLEIIKF